MTSVFAARRPDVLVFENCGLDDDNTCRRYYEVTSSNQGTDADWVVKVIDVFPGYSQQRNGTLFKNE
jgi:hypothetical protein